MTVDKSERQLVIKELISSTEISSQEVLVKRLKRKGFDINQATLSRDLKELGVAKINTLDGVQYVLNPEGEETRLKHLLSFEIESVRSNESLIVIKTLPGRAMGVARVLDSIELDDVLGTMAGDDTIFITPTSVKKIPQIEKAIRALVTQTE
jgi:transcriptional regulator of arginine metabolism